MSENTLASIVRGAREGGASVTSALGTGIKERLKEKLDPRQFINQTGLMTALFPKLKTYESKLGKSEKLSQVKEQPKSMSSATTDTEILAKNMMVLPAIHKDFNLMRQNLAKLVKLKGGKPVTKVDKDFFKAKERNAAFGQQTKPSSPTPEKPKSKTLDFLKIMGTIGLIGIGLKMGLEYVADKIKESLVESLVSIPDKISEAVKTLLSLPKDKNDIIKMGSSAIDYMQEDGIDRMLTPKFMEKLNEKMQKWQKGELEESDVDSETAYGTSADESGTSPSPMTGGYTGTGGEIIGNSDDIAAARKAADEYLGRKMSDDEWKALVNTTKAESARDSVSYAMVMGTILNRARNQKVRHGPNKGKRYSELPDPIVQAVFDPFQFEAVTGSEGNGFKPSKNFTRDVTPKEMAGMNYAAINILPKVSNQQTGFTATNEKAYEGKGHNLNYLKDMRANPNSGERAGTIFNTKPPVVNTPAAAAPETKNSGAQVQQSSQTLKTSKEQAAAPTSSAIPVPSPTPAKQSEQPANNSSNIGVNKKPLFEQLLEKASDVIGD